MKNGKFKTEKYISVSNFVPYDERSKIYNEVRKRVQIETSLPNVNGPRFWYYDKTLGFCCRLLKRMYLKIRF